ncbi:hypothetical protein ACIBLA_31960 [Streptomyces sp. NPDC050433]|uniref:hypothetical protein n=1 Tax=Streptomyces sp. NPDC050433 TaxID=3365615 RepID=UPI0037A1D352
MSHGPVSRPRATKPERADPGFRTRFPSKSVFAALRTMHREHPVLAHGVYTYLSVTGLLLALTAALAVQR